MSKNLFIKSLFVPTDPKIKSTNESQLKKKAGVVDKILLQTEPGAQDLDLSAET